MANARFTAKEQEKATILSAAIEGKITNDQAARQLGLSVRQVQRAKVKIRENGVSSIVHQLKGKPSNHRYTQETKTTVVKTIKEKYDDFKPSFATEKLAENDAIHISRETTRLWMIEYGLWKSRKQKQNQYRSWRPRKEYFGELEQFDGSYHYWFENRYCDQAGNPIEACLLAAIDDATGEITKATFSPNEGVEAVFTFWKQYVQKRGKPLSIYLDKFSTYKINHKAAVDNSELMTQFQRAMQTLGIILITAHSPQAKGRVEKLFETLQDRLVKEMRLAGVNAPAQGNRFLEEVFIPKFNQKFAVVPVQAGNVHKPLSETDRKNLKRIFSVQSKRKVNNDFTIQFKNRWLQLTEVQPTTVRARDTIIVEEWLDGTIHLSFHEHYLSFLLLPQRPQKIKKNPVILTTHKLNWKPPPNHPWKRRMLPIRG
jgi:hypothetical protein